jgi:hypothetical protein
MQKIGFVLFSNYHQKKDIGSSRIRGEYVIDYLEGAEVFIQGKEYDVIVFQKTFWKEMAKDFKGLKILDLCDPDWHEGQEIMTMINNIDAITVPSLALQEELSEFTDKQIFIIQDRYNLDKLPKRKVQREGKAKSCVWFGYSSGQEILDETVQAKIREVGLKLIVISDSDFYSPICKVENLRWDIKTAYKEIQKADFALLPETTNAKRKYKSNNKTILSYLLGLPVAKTAQEFDNLLNGEKRKEEADKKYRMAVKHFDSRISAKELQSIVDKFKK